MKEKYDHRLLLKHLPSDFRQLLEHLQTLEYADKPDYAMLLGLFERTMKRRGVRESDPFDWEKNASASANSSIAGEVAASTNAAVATGTNVALGSRNTAHLQATSAMPVSALAATAAGGGGGPDNQENNMQAAAAVDNQENLEPDNRKAVSEMRASEGGGGSGDPKAMPRVHLRAGACGAAAAAGLNGSAEAPGRNKAEVDKNCNANVAGRRSKDEEKAAEKAVDTEGDAVMAVVGGGSSANRDSGLFNLEMMTSRTEGDQEPPSPSPRIGGLWGQAGEGAQDSSQPLSFNVKGTLERRQRRLQHMGNKSSFKSRFTLAGGGSGGGGGGDNSVTQMAMMDDDNVSAAYTHGGGNAGLTLHSRWKSQFDDSEGEGSENETEMKGEHLQSPEHKQTPTDAAAAEVISPRQPQAATTPTTEKQKLKLSPPKTSPPKLLIATGSSSPRAKDPVPSPRPKGSSTSPEQQQRQQHSSSKQQQQPLQPQQQPSSPQVVIPPPPQLAPPPPPADFIPLQHSASAPSIPRSKAAPSTATTTTATAAPGSQPAAAAGDVTMTSTVPSTAALASSAPAGPTPAGFTPPPPPQFAPPPPPSTVALDSKTTSVHSAVAPNGLTTLKTTMAAAAAAMTPRSPFSFARHPLQHSTSVSSGIAASNAVVRPPPQQLSQAQQQQISQRLEQNQAHLQRPFLSRPPLAKSPLLQEPNLPAGGGSKDDDDDDDEEDDDEEEDDDDNVRGDRQQPPDYVAAVCQYTTILKDAPPGFDNEEYEVNYLNLEKGTKSESADRSMPRTWSNPQLCESNDSSGGGQVHRHIQQQQQQQQTRQRQESESPKCYNLELKAKQQRLQQPQMPQQQDVVVRKISMPARLPSSYSSDFRSGKSPARDIEYIEDDEEDEGEGNGGECASGTGQGVTGKFTFQGRFSVDF